MSGTSLDGVDVSIIKSDGNKEIHQFYDKYFEYDKELTRKKYLKRRNKKLIQGIENKHSEK